jgi:hypothetical protein
VPLELTWFSLGRQAFGLAHEGRLMAVLYWTPSEAGEIDGAGGEPMVTDPGFFLADTESPTEHVHVVDGENVTEDWQRAFDEANRLFLETHGYHVPEPEE